MISLGGGYLRAADTDDVGDFHRLYRSDKVRAALLDKAREPMLPTRDELSLMLSKKEQFKGGLYAVDDSAGEVRGFCALRGMVHDARYSEFSLLLYEDADYEFPLADEILEYIRGEAFGRYQMYKVISQCLDSEGAWRGFLQSRGFKQNGEQREVLFAGGKWHNLLTFSLYNPAGDKVFGALPHSSPEIAVQR